MKSVITIIISGFKDFNGYSLSVLISGLLILIHIVGVVVLVSKD